MLMYLTRCWKLHKNHITENSKTMKKLSKITESVWSDMQDRGIGDLEKKEDTIGNSNILKPVDLIRIMSILMMTERYHSKKQVQDISTKTICLIPWMKEGHSMDGHQNNSRQILCTSTL